MQVRKLRTPPTLVPPVLGDLTVFELHPCPDNVELEIGILVSKNCVYAVTQLPRKFRGRDTLKRHAVPGEIVVSNFKDVLSLIHADTPQNERVNPLEVFGVRIHCDVEVACSVFHVFTIHDTLDFVNNHFRNATEKVRSLFTGGDSQSRRYRWYL